MKHNEPHFDGKRMTASEAVRRMKEAYPPPWRVRPFACKGKRSGAGRVGLAISVTLAPEVHNRRQWIAPSWAQALSKAMADRRIASTEMVSAASPKDEGGENG